MNQRLKQLLMKAAAPLTARPGLRVLFDQTQLMETYRRLSRQGIPMQVIYDVGAHRGSWTEAMLGLFPAASFHLFDALPHAGPLARRHPNVSFHQVLLGNEERLVDFHSTGTTGDSIYREATTFYGDTDVERLPMHRLDRLVVEGVLPPPDLLKIDVQGAELDVLHGAGELVQQVSLIQLECSLVPYNQGAPLIGAVIDQLRAWNFLAVAIEPLVFTDLRSSAGGYPAGSFIPQVDILFAARRHCRAERFRACLP